MAYKVERRIIDLFRRCSLLDRMTFGSAISFGTGGFKLAYGCLQHKPPSTAAVRTINSCTPDVTATGAALKNTRKAAVRKGVAATPQAGT